MAGVYISPYTALIGAPNQTKAVITGVATYVICDDFTTDVSVNTPPWQAIGTNVAALQGEAAPDNVLKFDHGSTAAQAATQILDYTVAAYLAVEIMEAKWAGDVTKEGRLSFSLWGLFDPTSVDANGPLSSHWVTGSDLTYANQYLADARNAVLTQGLTPASFSNVTVYSPTPQSASQEYLVVSMAEPPFLALLGIDLLAVVGLILFVRRRFAGAVN